MAKYESPRDAEGAKLCTWCGGRIKQAGVGRSRDYCKQSCRQRAYEERKVVERIAKAVALPRDSSRDGGAGFVSPRDETRSVQAAPPDDYLLTPPAVSAADPGEGWVRSIDDVAVQLRELEAKRAAAAPPVSAPAPQKRRRLTPPPEVEAPTLFGP